MVNIIIPLAGKSPLFKDSPFPKPLFEVNNRLMVEYALFAFQRISEPKRFIFVLDNDECVKFHLDKTLKLLTSPDTVIVKQLTPTKGAACSCLLAIDHINNDDRLIISNGDHYLNVDGDGLLKYFDEQKADGGLLTFHSVHPQWSYVKLNANNVALQTAEKNPISRSALVGFYYFRRGKDFVAAAMDSIEKQTHVDGKFYIAPVYNELILREKRIVAVPVKPDEYHSFYSFPKIREFEKLNVSIG